MADAIVERAGEALLRTNRREKPVQAALHAQPKKHCHVRPEEEHTSRRRTGVAEIQECL